MRLAFLAVLMAASFGLVAAADAGGQRPKLIRKAPTVTAAPPVVKAGDGTFRKKVLLALVRHKTVTQLQTVGIGGKKMTRIEAEAAYDKLTPDVIDGAIAEASPDTAAQLGAVGGPLTDFLDWLSTHGDQIMAIVALVMKLLALFGG